MDAKKLRGHFIIIALLCLVVMVLVIVYGRRWWILFLMWPCISFFAIAIAYEDNNPSVLGKNPTSGSIGWSMTIIFLPYLTLVWSIWKMRNLTSSEPHYHEVAPRILLGRFCNNPAVLANKKIAYILDMTAEFSEPLFLVKDKIYVCIPTLDAESSRDILRASKALKQIQAWYPNSQDYLYIHCAAGHGRSCMMACVCMVVCGLEPNWQAAFQRIKKYRKMVYLHNCQQITAHKLVIATV